MCQEQPQLGQTQAMSQEQPQTDDVLVGEAPSNARRATTHSHVQTCNTVLNDISHYSFRK
eukprot:3868678-Amphidinium_carterae.1